MTITQGHSGGDDGNHVEDDGGDDNGVTEEKYRNQDAYNGIVSVSDRQAMQTPVAVSDRFPPSVPFFFDFPKSYARILCGYFLLSFLKH
ncbi:hypothetical protein PoB_000383400 [Plakobranchus ocellatus]|uniref:CTNNB1 binding N-teminal domain-containing protein n=1 Tax=Plakobranchus ocellatus TaxID=259542 RepID=A0AAV3Y534_9GAST|nr:hypothetical protein PoB_000383400 [Plakobranchus ocellatus]